MIYNIYKKIYTINRCEFYEKENNKLSAENVVTLGVKLIEDIKCSYYRLYKYHANTVLKI